MNFKNTAKQLENLLEEELSKYPPVAILQDGSIVYNNFLIKKNKKEEWVLRRVKGSVIDTFATKACALSAAKLYSANNFSKYSEIKILDNLYAKNSLDAYIFKQKYTNSKDYQLKDMFIARYTESRDKAVYARKEIATRFRTLF